MSEKRGCRVVAFGVVLGLSGCTDIDPVGPPEPLDPRPDHRIATDQAAPFALAADDTSLYWLNGGSRDALDNYVPGAIMTMPLAGGEPRVLVPAVVYGSDFVLDDDYLYWAEDGKIERAAKDGSRRTVLIADHPALELAVSGERLAWRETGGIFASAKDGTDVVTIDAAADPLYFAVAVDDAYVYWASNGTTVRRAPADGTGTAEELVAGRPVERLEVTATHLFMGENPGDKVTIARMDLTTRTVVNIGLEPDTINPNLAIDGDTAYFTVQNRYGLDDDSLMVAPHEPGAPALLDDQQRITSIVVTDAAIYYTTNSLSDGPDGAVNRLER